MRGFISGVVWGLALAVLGVATLSVLSPLAPTPDVTLQAPHSVGTVPVDEGQAPADMVTVDPDVVEAAPGTSVGETPKAGDLEQVAESDTAPSEPPDVAVVSEALESPAEPATAPGVSASDVNDAADLPKTASKAPAVPVAESDVAAETATPEPPKAADATEAAKAMDSNATEPADSPSVVTGSDPAPSGTGPTVVVTEPAEDPAPQTSTESAPLPTAAAEPEPEISVQAQVDAPVAPAVQPEPETLPVPEAVPAPAPETLVTAESGTGKPDQVAVLPQTGTDTDTLRPTIGKRVRPLTERTETEIAITPVEETEDNSDLPPLQRFAEPFENPENKPLMSIVLIDDDASVGVEALQEFPYPLTFAIDPAAADAAEKMARHRAAGFEVVALVDLPESATARDAEVSLAAGFGTLSEAVGVLEGTGSGVQGNRDLSGQVAAFVKDTGRGLVMQDSGLNTVYKLAVRDGVPAAVVFRDFDGAGQDPTMMRRFLDQAAFRAGQDGGVVMMGRVRPDTISALLLWGLQDRASRVALAPVSAVLARTVAAE